MKKVLFLTLSILMVMLITTGALAADYKIGFNNYLSGLYCLDVLENFADYSGKALNCTLVPVNDEAKIEKSVSNVENLLASGVDGIVFFGIADSLFPVVAKKCADAKVPFVIYDHLPTPRTLALLRKNPYFVGAVGENDYDAGYPIGEYAREKGLKKAIIVTCKRGDTTHEARVKGFTDAFGKNGGQVVDIGWGCLTRSDALAKTEDLLVAHPDIDCIYSSSGDVGVGSMEILQKHPEVKAELFLTDLDPEILTGLKNMTISAANGAHWVNSGLAVALLHNWLEGHPLKDKNGRAPVFNVPILVLPNYQADLYQKFWLENMPYGEDEIRNMSYKWNPRISTEAFQAVMDDYSIEERLLKKFKEGKLTEQELKKYGF